MEVKDLKLKRLDDTWGWYSDEQMKDMLVSDLPVFNRDGHYYSRALKRTWHEVRGKTYECGPHQYTNGEWSCTVEARRKDNVGQFLYDLAWLESVERDCGEEIARKLEAVYLGLRRTHRCGVAPILYEHGEIRKQEQSRRSLWQHVLKVNGKWAPVKTKPIPLP